MFVGLCPGLRVELCDTVTVLQRDETVGERELPNQIIRGYRVQGVARSVVLTINNSYNNADIPDNL